MFFLPGAFHSAPRLLALLPLGATERVYKQHEITVHFGWSAQPLLALIAGILILIMPRLLNFVVAAYLIIVGLIGIFGFRW
jgi:hypothetical protein